MKNKGKHKFVKTKTKMRKKMIGNFFRGVMPKKNDRKLFFPSQTKKRNGS